MLKAFFAGKPVGKPITVNAKEKSTVELKDPLNVSGGDEKEKQDPK